MNWFKKLFGTKSKAKANTSLSLGQEKVGIPQRQVVEAVFAEIENQSWTNFDESKVNYYMDGMLFNHLMRLLQQSLSEDDLKNLDTNKVRAINLLLLRDNFRHNADLIRPSTTENWIDPLFNKLFLQFKIPENATTGFDTEFDLETFNADWAKRISEPLGLESHKLFVTHASIVTGVRED